MDFNHEAAEWAVDVVSKMDEDAREIFMTAVVHDVLHDYIDANRRTVDRKVGEIMKRMEYQYTRAGDDEAAGVVSLVAKSLWDESKVKRDEGGKFSRTESRRVKVQQVKPVSRVQEQRSGIPNPKDMALRSQTYAGGRMTPQQRSAYQQEYLAIADSLNRAVDTGGSEIQVVFQDKRTGNRQIANVSRLDDLTWNPYTHDAVEIRTKSSGALDDTQRAAYDVVSALGGSRDTARSTGTATRALDAAARGGFADHWAEAALDTGSSTAPTFNRIQSGAALLGSVSNNKTVQTMSSFGEFVGNFGPEAEKIIGPAMRKTTYRYRGTERKVEPELIDLAKEETGKVFSASLPDDPNIMQMGAARIAGPSDEQKVAGATTAAIKYLNGDGGRFKGKLPSQRLSELQIKSGKVPPSEGVIIDSSGNIHTQAIGYAEDHYLPFNLRNLKALKGGTYVRTRSTGGLTTEDIYTGLVAGARQVTVVSNSGIFTIDFEDDFRGIRRHSDKARQMVQRYAKTLDAIKLGSIERTPIPASERARIREEVSNHGFTGPDYNKEVARREKEWRSPEITQDEIKSIEDKIFSEAHNVPGSEETQERWARGMIQREIAALLDERENRFMRLDGEGYAMALQAMKEQFPYYISDVSFTQRRGAKSRGGEATPYLPGDPLPTVVRRMSNRSDAGYVKAGFNRPEEVQEGFYDESITGHGKRSADTVDYQNWKTNPNRKKTRTASAQPQEVPAQGGDTPKPSRPLTAREQLSDAKRRAAANRNANAAVMDLLAATGIATDENVAQLLGDSSDGVKQRAAIIAARKKEPETPEEMATLEEALRKLSAKLQAMDETVKGNESLVQAKIDIKNALQKLDDSKRDAATISSAREYAAPAYRHDANIEQVKWTYNQGFQKLVNKLGFIRQEPKSAEDLKKMGKDLRNLARAYEGSNMDHLVQALDDAYIRHSGLPAAARTRVVDETVERWSRLLPEERAREAKVLYHDSAKTVRDLEVLSATHGTRLVRAIKEQQAADSEKADRAVQRMEQTALQSNAQAQPKQAVDSAKVHPDFKQAVDQMNAHDQRMKARAEAREMPRHERPPAKSDAKYDREADELFVLDLKAGAAGDIADLKARGDTGAERAFEVATDMDRDETTRKRAATYLIDILNNPDMTYLITTRWPELTK